ncbi:MAG: amidohydrolase, partial [Bacillota bacterium]|nr:amidohydrolase [Bacillota bacterium]
AVEQGANLNWVLKTEGYTGVVAEFDSGKKGPVIGFRFDIDALPYEEPKEIGFKPFDEGYISHNSKKVHACAHDGHTAIGLGLAEEIIKNKNNIKGKIKFFFQPAEETFSGAESIVAKGHLDEK